VSDLLTLRPYQREAIDAVWDALEFGTTRPAVVSATGSGKTVMFSHMAKEWTDTHAPGRSDSNVLILVDREELAGQTRNKLRDVAPTLPVGIVKAARNEIAGRRVIVASAQTLAREGRREQIENIGLVIADECHHAAAQSWHDILRHFGCLPGGCADLMWEDSRTPAVGFTATLSHTNKNALAAVWEKVVFERDILEMIPEFLCDVRGIQVTVDGLSLAEVATRGGDFAPESLSAAMVTPDVVTAVVTTWLEEASNRPTFVYVPSIAATAVYANAFWDAGVTTGVITGYQSEEERAHVLKQFREGDLRVIVNCMVLTYGIDEPCVSCIVLARPTKSQVLYVQIVGRGLRLYPGKSDCLVLDVVGATQDHLLATIADLTTRRLSAVLPGETLTQAVRREKEAGNPSLADYVVGKRDVDLFHRSRSLWTQTKAGVWYIRTAKHVWFLWPNSGGSYSVAWRNLYSTGGQFLREGLSLDLAMTWAEQFALEEDPKIADRSAPWRRKPPTAKTLDLAMSIGLYSLESPVPSGMKAGELSQEISVHMVSALLDGAL
jgi:superfamily II DNA or RNA helicase